MKKKNLNLLKLRTWVESVKNVNTLNKPKTIRNSDLSLRKHAYSNMSKILPPKNENFQIKFFDIFDISAQNIDSGYSLEPPR